MTGRGTGRHDQPPLPVSPSGRTPQWVIEEARERARRESLSPLERATEDRRSTRARRNARRHGIGPAGIRRTSWAAVAAVLAVVVAGPWAVGTYIAPHVSPYLPGASAPPLGVEASPTPIGTPPQVPDTAGYRFHDDVEQQMVAFDPCRPVHYVVRAVGAPEGAEQLVHAAVAEIETATGLDFVYDGTTEEGPDPERNPYQPGRYGHRWAPVLITWTDEGEVADLAGEVVGLGGPIVRQEPDGPYVNVSGHVMLDTPELLLMGQRPDGLAHVRATIIHELAHVVGLDHIDDPAQLMHATSSAATGLASGDRAGLAKLGAGRCAPKL